jgi:hypothetical protein
VIASSAGPRAPQPAPHPGPARRETGPSGRPVHTLPNPPWRPLAQVLLPALRADMSHSPLPADVAQAAQGPAAAAPQPGGPAGPECVGGACSGDSAGGGAGLNAHDPRPYLLCCVRLSPEKEPLRFVDLVAELQRRGALERHGAARLAEGPWSPRVLGPDPLECRHRGRWLSWRPLQKRHGTHDSNRPSRLTRPSSPHTPPHPPPPPPPPPPPQTLTPTPTPAAGLVPFMIGASDSEYARGVKAALRAAAPGAVVEERFLGPGELVEQVRCGRPAPP